MVTIEVANKLPEEIQQRVIDGLNRQAAEKKNLAPMEPFALLAYDKGVVVGSLSGFIIYGGAYIDLLYVEDVYRRQSVGAQLMKSVEDMMRSKFIKFITLNTFDFEARPFYEKCGYQVEFERPGYNNQSTMCYMIKHLSD